VRNRFRVRKGNFNRKRLLLLGAGLLGAVALFELYQLVIPFQSANPLWHQVTTGETVINDWKYEGQDEEGYLKFYNQGQTNLLPPNARTFDADGKFVVIEGHTPSTLTYALPYEAVPMRWVALVVGATGIAIGVWALRKKVSGKRLKFARRRGTPIQIRAKKSAEQRSKSFRVPRKFRFFD
jgi:hypothetical protein